MVEEKKTTKKAVVEKAEPKKGSAKFAVIKTGGKQYLVEEGRYYNFEKLPEEEGKTVTFSNVLLTIDGANVKIGKPKVDVEVTGKVLSQFKDDTIKVFKYKKRKRYRKTYGHRQSMTKVEITKIG